MGEKQIPEKSSASETPTDQTSIGWEKGRPKITSGAL